MVDAARADSRGAAGGGTTLAADHRTGSAGTGRGVILSRRAVPRGQRGFALLIVLWTIGILAALIAGLAADASSESKLSMALRSQAVARAAADGVLSAVILDVLRAGATAAGLRRFGDTPVTVGLVDLSGRMNPNLASAVMLQSLLLGLGVLPQSAESHAAAIVDWRTPGLTPSPHGAKATEYRTAGMTYGPPGRPFENLDEWASCWA